MNNSILSLRNLTKTYPGVIALNDVSLDFRPGEVHALLGENGAGKSTLIKVIAGAIEPDSGTLDFGDGNVMHSLNPRQAKALGVEAIFQEFNLVDALSAAENICLGEKSGRFVNFRWMEDRARKIFDEFGIDIDPRAEVMTLPTSKQQIVEIAKAVSKNARILIMDEPTAPLSMVDVEHLFRMIRLLKERGITIIYISHRMDELFAITDRVTVMRDGRYIATLDTKATDRTELINLMVGPGTQGESNPRRRGPRGLPLLEVRHLTGNGDQDISFQVHRGEILGIAGLVGAGRTELVRMIYGADCKQSGVVVVDGKATAIRSPKEAIRNGIGLIPEDRKLHGCLLTISIHDNISLSCLPRLSKLGVIGKKKEKALVDKYVGILKIKTPSVRQLVGNLSGGNQQKVVMAKTLAT